MPRKKQGLRSYHHKSRNGCSNCKRRRVKCNMQAPACANCVRRNEVCEYQNLNSTPNTPIPQIPSNAPNTPVNAEVPISSLAAVSSSFQSYAQNTAWEQQHLSPQIFPDPAQSPPSLRSFIYSLLNRSWFGPSEVPKWADALEEQCQKYEYLRHCIYAVAYLRRDLIDQPIDGTPVLAYQHQVAASRLFCQESLAVNADNWIAVIGFHVFMLIFQFSTQSRCKDDEFNLTDTMAMLRSSMTIEEEAQKFFHQSQFWEDILKRTELLPQEIDHGLRRSLQSLATIISSSIENEENDDDEEELAEINRQAFWELREWVHECEARPRRWDQYSAWPARTTPEYIELLEDKDDIALLIFLHWAALTYRSPKPAVYNWARRAGFYAINNLKRDWSEILVWPLEVLSEPRPLLGTMTYRLGQTASLAQHHSASAASTSAGGSNIGFERETLRGNSSNLDPSLLLGVPGELDPAFFGDMAGSSNIDHSFLGGGPEYFHMAMPAHTTGSLDPALFASSSGDMDFGMHVLPSSNGAPDIDLIPARTRFS